MRIAIVNDMILAVEALRRVVASRPEHSVAWIARDGADAVRRCAEDRPDIILMDLIMPVMNGVEATRIIMRDSPCAILLVTASVDQNISLVFEAMGHGALDAVNTPVLGSKGDVSGADELTRKIDVVGKLVAKPTRFPSFPGIPISRPSTATDMPILVAIGSSTGGPAALAQILADLGRVPGAAFVVVQHVSASFAPELASWLRFRCGMHVTAAAPGDRPEVGAVRIARTDDHMVLTAAGTLDYTTEPRDSFYRPSVDVFFKSVALHWPRPGVAVLLTGMGRDGAIGMLALKVASWHTIAQDEGTSVVWGMPRAAIELGAANEVLPLPSIAQGIIRAVAKVTPIMRTPPPLR